MPVLSNAASIKVGTQQAAKVMLGATMVWEFYTWEMPESTSVQYAPLGFSITSNETSVITYVYPLYHPDNLVFGA